MLFIRSSGNSHTHTHTHQQMDRPLDASDMRSMIQAKSEVSNLRKLVGNLGTKLFGGPDMSEAARKAEKKKRDLEYKTNYLSGWRPLSSSQVNRRLKRISGKLDSAKYCKKGGDLKFEFEVRRVRVRNARISLASLNHNHSLIHSLTHSINLSINH